MEGGDSPESYCLIDTPEKDKKKPLTRAEDLPSAEESEEKKEKKKKEKKETSRKKSRKTSRKKTKKA